MLVDIWIVSFLGRGIANNAALSIFVHIFWCTYICISVTFKMIFIYSFIFWLCWIFPAVWTSSLVAVASGGYSPVVARGLLVVVASHCRAQALGVWAAAVAAHGLRNCGSWALEHGLSSWGTPA